MRWQAQLIMVTTATTGGCVLFSTRCTFQHRKCKIFAYFGQYWLFCCEFSYFLVCYITYGRNVVYWPGWMLVDTCTHTGPLLVTAHTLTCHHSFNRPVNNIFLLIPRNIFNLVNEAYLQGGKLQKRHESQVKIRRYKSGPFMFYERRPVPLAGRLPCQIF